MKIYFIIGIANFITQDPRIQYLEKALLADESKLREFGIKVGILGQPRIDYDVMLMRLTKDEDHAEKEIGVDLEKEKWEKRDSDGIQRKIVSSYIWNVVLLIFATLYD